MKSDYNFQKTNRYKVVINRYSLDEITTGQSDVSYQFNISFGPSYYKLLFNTLGKSFQVAEVRPANNDKILAAIFPFTVEHDIKCEWAKKIGLHASNWANLIESRNDVAVMDFSSVAPDFKGNAADCFRAVAQKINLKGFSYGITEVQWLRQLILWLRKDWNNITPLPENMHSLYHDVTFLLKNKKDPKSILKDGQRLIWQNEPIYNKPKWNVVLEQSVYLAYNFNKS